MYIKILMNFSIIKYERKKLLSIMIISKYKIIKKYIIWHELFMPR